MALLAEKAVEQADGPGFGRVQFGAIVFGKLRIHRVIQRRAGAAVTALAGCGVVGVSALLTGLGRGAALASRAGLTGLARLPLALALSLALPLVLALAARLLDGISHALTKHGVLHCAPRRTTARGLHDLALALAARLLDGLRHALTKHGVLQRAPRRTNARGLHEEPGKQAEQAANGHAHQDGVAATLFLDTYEF